MTIRRGDRTCDIPGDVDLSAASDDEGSTAFDGLIRELNSNTKDMSLLQEPRLNPTITDFGPHSLTRFIREEINKAKAERIVGKGKAKANHTDAELCFDGSAETISKESVVTYADNALRHLRGLPDAPTKRNAVLKAPLQSKQPVQSASRNSPSQYRRLADSSDSQTPYSQQDSHHVTRRSMDFEDHAESVRNRNWLENQRISYRDLARTYDTNDSNDSDESTLRPRKTAESLSHLVSLRSSTPEPQHSTFRRFEPPPRTPRAIRAMVRASSQLSISDGEGGEGGEVRDVLDTYYPPPASTALHQLADVVDSNQGSFNNPADPDDPDTDDTDDLDDPDDPHGAIGAFSFDLRDADLDLETILRTELKARRETMLARRQPNHLSASSSSFDYAACVPSASPQFETSTAVVPKTTPTTPQKSSKSRPDRRQRAASTEGREPDHHDWVVVGKKGAKSDKSTKTKSTKRIAMVFDSSKPAWSVENPLPDVGRPGYTPPDPDRDFESTTLPGFNYDIWIAVADYLSSDDIRRLRLLNSFFAIELAPILFRSVVTRFGKDMFHLGSWDDRGMVLPVKSILAKYGKDMHRFGISFDYDSNGLAFAKPKVFTRQENAWYGSYRWPLEMYPRYSQLQELEDLVDDNRPLLRDAFADLKSVSELALSLDSGHGWLEGPDVSDLALFEARRQRGTKVFGQTFAEDIWHTYGRNEYFKWAQQNSINACKKLMGSKADTWLVRQKIDEFSRLVIRDYDSFCAETTQPDFDPHSHTGGQAGASPAGVGQGAQQAQQHPPQVPGVANFHALHQAAMNALTNAPAQPTAPPAPTPQSTRGSRHRRQTSATTSKGSCKSQSPPIPLQYPIIFNCYNIAADVGGREHIDEVADPSHHPLIGGHLTEAQVQWLMETLWAQRAFLSAYTTSVITHKLNLRKVHTFTIAKLSSGLLPSLAQREFWNSLTGLKRLKILLKPDWRDEHIPGDKFYGSNMPVNPCVAASKFADFLEQYIARLENLSHLTIGYFGGGEHATGMFARNLHVLPAPITNSPRKWISDHDKKPNLLSLFAFPHIRDLRFENCWFSSCMLEAFMEKSRDTSLHTLVLDSVSMLAKHSTGIDGALSTIRNNLRCYHDADNWLLESLPASAVWVEILDKITPGQTMLERKHKAGMLEADFEVNPVPLREFRGNISKIVLKSCGYAKISGVKGDKFNQNTLVVQTVGTQVAPIAPAQGQGQQNAAWRGPQGSMCDAGLLAHKARFDKLDVRFMEDRIRRGTGDGAGLRNFLPRRDIPGQTNGGSGLREGTIMMSTSGPDGKEYFGLGTLTQCVHPIEKRVLESAWGMKFGWGDDMKRWGAVEDGWFEGGTGRFSGVVGVEDSYETDFGVEN